MRPPRPSGVDHPLRLEEAARREEAERDGTATSKYRMPVLLVTLVLSVLLFGRAIFWEASRARPSASAPMPSPFGGDGTLRQRQCAASVTPLTSRANT